MLDDEEEVPEGGGSDVSEFTTDEDVEEEQEYKCNFAQNVQEMDTKLSFLNGKVQHYGPVVQYLHVGEWFFYYFCMVLPVHCFV